MQGLSPRCPLVHAGYDPAADIKYPSDTLRSPLLAARANLIVAIPSSRAARGLERLPSPASVSHMRQNSSAPASNLSGLRFRDPRLSRAVSSPAVRDGSCSRRGQLRAIRVRSSWRTGRQFPRPATGPQPVSSPSSDARALPKAAIARRPPRAVRPTILPTGSGDHEIRVPA